MTPLRQRMIEDMQVRNLALNTQRSYVEQVSRFARHFNKSPETLGPEQIRSYQIYLTNERKLDPGSVIIAVAALRFLYKVTLHKEWKFQEVIPAPKEASEVIGRAQPRGGPSIPGLRARTQTSDHSDLLLCSGSTSLRSHRFVGF